MQAMHMILQYILSFRYLNKLEYYASKTSIIKVIGQSIVACF